MRCYFLRLQRPLLPHILIVRGLAALYHVAVGIEQGSRNLIGEAIFGFGWHAVKATAVALPVVGSSSFTGAFCGRCADDRFESCCGSLNSQA